MSQQSIFSDYHAHRQSAVDELAMRLLNHPAALTVVRARKDGTPISYQWGSLHIRHAKVAARARELSEQFGTASLAPTAKLNATQGNDGEHGS